jgi:hypothetical protein
MSTCTNLDLLRDYAFDEIAAADRPAFERHLADCADCAAELDRLRLTTAALRILPDRELPQRIAFVSDKVFAPWRIWNFAPWLGFVSAGVMAVALMVSSHARPPEVRTIAVQTASTQSIEEIVQKAVAKAQAQTQAEDARILKAALAQSDAKHEREHQTLIDAVNFLQLHQSANILTSEVSAPQNGFGQ